MCHDSAVASKEAARAPEAEIEVTPEMAEAGYDVFCEKCWDVEGGIEPASLHYAGP